MVTFDSVEYWKSTTWDRHIELKKVPALVRQEFMNQEKMTVDKTLELVNTRPNTRILDLACGTGKIAESILRHAKPGARVEITLVDFNIKTLETARSRLSGHSNITFVAADAYSIGRIYKDYFDIVIALDLLHHMEKLNFLLIQISNSMKPDGVFISNTFETESYAQWDRIKYGVVKSRWRRFVCSAAKAAYHGSPSTAQRAIRRLGLARIEPLSKSDIDSTINTKFEYIQISRTFYLWFVAKPLPAPIGQRA